MCRTGIMNKVQVVYCLSHGGRLEQPHLIEVERQNDSLTLSDVKKRLTVLRGKEMPDAFSWAYKRSYKNDFIWNDITGDDIILPLSGNEYTLKGSENVYDYQENCRHGRIAGSRKQSQIYLDDSFETPVAHKRSTNRINENLRASETFEKPSPFSSGADSRSSKNPDDFCSERALRVNRQLMESLTQAKTGGGECIVEDMSSENLPSEGSSNRNFTDVKVYKTPASPVTADHGKDAATQTEDHRGSISREETPSRAVTTASRERVPTQLQCEEAYSPALRKPGRVLSSTRKQSEEAVAFKTKQPTSAMVLRQLLSCGGIDTNTSPSVHNILQSPGQNWPWSKTKADGKVSSARMQDVEMFSKSSKDVPVNLEAVGLKEGSPVANATANLSFAFSKGDCNGSQDPEFMPEVVKETSYDSYSLKDLKPSQWINTIAKDLEKGAGIECVVKTPRQQKPIDKVPRESKVAADGVSNISTTPPKEARRVDGGSPRYSVSKRYVGRDTSALKNVTDVDMGSQSPAVPWADLSPPKKELKSRDDRPLTPGRSRLDWEKSLQEAVSTAPADFRQFLQECPQCGRTFKPDSLRVHMRGCRGQSGKIASMSHVARRLQ